MNQSMTIHADGAVSYNQSISYSILFAHIRYELEHAQQHYFRLRLEF